MNLPVQNRTAVSIYVALAFCLTIIYGIPYFVPVHDGLSLSYMFGYNNRAAMLLIVASTTAFAVWTRGLGLTLPDPSALPQEPIRWSGYYAIAISILGAIFLWICATIGFPFGEAQYFLDRYEMYRNFGNPYHAFTFYYGPIMFYLPLWVAHIAHISVGNGYYLSLVMEWAVGTWALWKTVHLAARGTTHGRTIFLLFWLVSLTCLMSNGAQYSIVRYALPLAFALVVEDLYRRGISMATTFGVASMGTVATLFYSPEQGVSFVIATLLFFLLCVRTRRRGTLLALCCFVAVFAAVCLVSARIGLFGSILSFGRGSTNFPVIPTFATAALLLILIVGGCVVVGAFRSHNFYHPLLYLIFISFFNLPAAFSRADAGHILFNTLGALVAVSVVLSQYPAIWRWTRIGLTILVMLFWLGALPYLRYVHGQIAIAAFSSQNQSSKLEKLVSKTFLLAEARGTSRLNKLRTKYSKLVAPEGPVLPYGTRALAPFGAALKITPLPGGIQVISGNSILFFSGITGVGVVQEKIDELSAHPDWPLFLPPRIDCEQDFDEVRQYLKGVLGAPFVPRPRRRITAVIPLCDYINANYHPSNYISPAQGSIVWLPDGRMSTTPNEGR